MQIINLSAVPELYLQVLKYSQGDIGREFQINVIDFEIPAGATVQLLATKPSGFGFTKTCTVSGNTVSFETTEDMTDEYGRFPAELRITYNSEIIGTANFCFYGERDPHPDGTTDGQAESVVPELTTLVEEILASNAKVESMTVSVDPLSPGSTPTASYDAEANNIEFGIPTISFADDDSDGNIVIS